jgi:hypothetical protein
MILILSCFQTAESKGEKEFNKDDGKVLRNERYYGTASRA